MMHFLDFKWGYLLSLGVERLEPRLSVFAEAVYNSGCTLTHCWGFIDGTVRGIARCGSALNCGVCYSAAPLFMKGLDMYMYIKTRHQQ